MSPAVRVPWRVGRAIRRTRGRLAWGARAARHRLLLSDRPRVFCNSFQKSGTHLLVGLAAGVPPYRAYGRKTYWHAVHRGLVDDRLRKSPGDVVADLDGALPGEILRGHVEHHPAIAERLAREDWRHLLVLRDPRDALVSLMHWWKRHAEIDTWPFRLYRTLATDEDRLRFLIEGWDSDLVPADWPREVDFPDVATRYRAFAGWLAEPACLVVRFEDLTDAAGRGAALRAIARHLRPDLRAGELDAVLARMERAADPGRSKTFRRGTTGEWRRHLAGPLAERFDQLAGSLLEESGYAERGDAT